MKIEIKNCTVDGSDISVLMKVDATFEGFKEEADHQSGYRYDKVMKRCTEILAEKLTEEYLAKHKMDIINTLSKEDIVNAIQLKMIETFHVGG